MSAIDKEVEVQVLNGENFETQKVKIKLIMPSQFKKYLGINIIDDFELIKANTGLTTEQIDKFHPDSINSLAEEIKILNANGFYKYLRSSLDKTMEYMSDFDEPKLRVFGYLREKGLVK